MSEARGMNIYVISQEADYDEYQGFTVAAHNEKAAERVISDFICPPGETDYFSDEGIRPLTDEERRERVQRVWPTKARQEWRGPLNRTARLVGVTTDAITEPTVLLCAFRAG